MTVQVHLTYAHDAIDIPCVVGMLHRSCAVSIVCIIIIVMTIKSLGF